MSLNKVKKYEIMVRGVETNAKVVKKRHKDPFWYQRDYKKSAKLFGASVGKVIGGAIKSLGKPKKRKNK